MTEYKLMYFNGRGLAEVSRYIFAYADQKYEDFRWEFADWATEWKPKMPLGQGPCLEVKEGGNTYMISQSNTMARFLAKRFNLAGANDVEAAKIDMVNDQLQDLNSYFRTANYEQPDEESKKAALEKFASTKLVQYFETLENLLANWGGEFAVGTAMSFADFNIALYGDRFVDSLGGNLEKFPRINAIRNKVNSDAKIAAWRSSRPQTQF